MDKYFLFDNKICNNGVAMENRSVVDSLNHLFKENQSLRKSISEQHNKIVDLETKLAEKEKEIEYQESMKILAVKNQNQKAIAELEKVKEKVRDVSGALALCEIEVQIDQQIKSLKGENQ